MGNSGGTGRRIALSSTAPASSAGAGKKMAHRANAGRCWAAAEDLGGFGAAHGNCFPQRTQHGSFGSLMTCIDRGKRRRKALIHDATPAMLEASSRVLRGWLWARTRPGIAVRGSSAPGFRGAGAPDQRMSCHPLCLRSAADETSGRRGGACPAGVQLDEHASQEAESTSQDPCRGPGACPGA